MDLKLARILLENLFERLEADAALDKPRFTSTVSNHERQAIQVILAVDSKRQRRSTLENQSEDDHVETSMVSLHSAKATDATNGVISVSDPQDPNGTFALHPAAPVDLVLSACGGTSDRGMIICIDFGTAKSKAFAASVEDDEDPEPLMLELGLGKLDEDPNDVYSISSSVWVSDDGRLYAGSSALVKSASADGVMRRRLDSIKQELSLNDSEHDLGQRLLEKELNPYKVPMSYEEALCFFLAYLTDLIGKELARHGYSRYMRRRFTLPAWQPAQRRWAAKVLWENLKRAQILADTFSGRWAEGIPVESLKSAFQQSIQYSAKVEYLMDGTIAESGGLTEPLAVGSSRVWADRSARNLMLVVDVGAGTTDLSLFWVVQDAKTGSHRAFPVAPSSYALRMAGDLVDHILVKNILEQVYGHPDEITRMRIEAGLRRRGVRGIKEQLFLRGQVSVPLVTDQVVTITRDEFSSTAPIQKLKQEFRNAISTFLSKADASWAKVPDAPLIVLTGGSAALPFIAALADESWKIGDKVLRFRKATTVPQRIADTFDTEFQKEYPQLAVAVGGVLPLLDEKSMLKEWLGGATTPGPLERYSVTGA